MFEIDKYDGALHRHAPALPQMNYEPVGNIDGMSFLLWAEHCVECAAPACYTSCDLYQPRNDSRCRRFAFGAYKNTAFDSARGYGVEIRFKKWAKLEAFGNASIQPIKSVLRLERALERTAPLLSRVGTVGHRLSGNTNLEQLSYIATQKLSRAFHRRRASGVSPEAFLLEVYNPESEEVRLQVIFSLSTDDMPGGAACTPPVPSVARTIVLPHGYSRHQFEAAAFRQILDRGLPFKITIVPEADNDARLVFLTADLVTFKLANEATLKNRPASPIKCVVWDLDNTVWNGTLVEGDELTLRDDIKQLLAHLDERGILVSVASKNDREPALAKLTEFAIAEYFVYPQIDWQPKSQKLKKIAQQLNIGLDALAFVDDSQFELDEVAQALPQITCVNAAELERLTNDPRFAGSLTEEARQRRRYYQQQISRETEQASFGEDYVSFLRSCAILLELSAYNTSDAERIAELVQRTNQLNFSGRKYTRAELDQVLANPALEKYVLRCSDKYGSYGTVGFCLAREGPQRIEIVDFMLSCRVQGKFVEQAFFAHLFESHNPHGAGAMWVNFRPTDRNTPARQVLESLGFQACERSEADSQSGLILTDCSRLSCDFIGTSCTAGDAAKPAPLAVAS
jgi:FkbH-like protein